MCLCTSKWFDRIILLFIFLNCVVLAMESPDLDPSGWVCYVSCFGLFNAIVGQVLTKTKLTVIYISWRQVQD